jgi:hypothetical protein
VNSATPPASILTAASAKFVPGLTLDRGDRPTTVHPFDEPPTVDPAPQPGRSRRTPTRSRCSTRSTIRISKQAPTNPSRSKTRPGARGTSDFGTEPELGANLCSVTSPTSAAGTEPSESDTIFYATTDSYPQQSSGAKQTSAPGPLHDG